MIQYRRQGRGSGRLYRATSTTRLCREISIVWNYPGSAVLRYWGQALQRRSQIRRYAWVRRLQGLISIRRVPRLYGITFWT
jgi:hypothetical protein